MREECGWAASRPEGGKGRGCWAVRFLGWAEMEERKI